MRILDEDNDKSITSVLIMLTPSEAKELASKLQQLTSEDGDHLHVDDEAYKREITMAIYTLENLNSFNHRVRELLNEED